MRAKREDLAGLPGAEAEKESRKRARVDICRKEGGRPTPPKATGLGLIEREPDDPDELIGAYQRLEPLLDNDEELEMLDRSHPLPSLEVLEKWKNGQKKVLEPMEIPPIPALGFTRDSCQKQDFGLTTDSP